MVDLMNSETSIISFTHLGANFFQYDEEGELPFAMCIVASLNPDIIVENTITKITEFWSEYLRQNPIDNIDLTRITTSKISYGYSEEEMTDIIINPDTLVMILSYSDERERVITLELASTPEQFTLH